MRHFLPLFAAAALWLSALTASAQENPVLVELFTSQGCSSCPPADALLHELAQREDVIALAFHVDYWDYIGWKDSFGDPKHAERQRAYASTAGRRTIYTPEMMVQGQSEIVGAKPMKLAKAIAQHARADQKVALKASRSEDQLVITAQMLNGATGGKMQVYVLRFTPNESVEIKRGENRGKTLKYANIVSDLTAVAHWDGAAPLTLDYVVTGDKPVVVIIQGAEAGPVLAAVVVR